MQVSYLPTHLELMIGRNKKDRILGRFIIVWTLLAWETVLTQPQNYLFRLPFNFLKFETFSNLNLFLPKPIFILMQTIIKLSPAIFISLFLTSTTLSSQSWQTLDSLGGKNYFDRKYDVALTYATRAIETYRQEVGLEDTIYVDLLTSKAEVLGKLEKYNEEFKEYTGAIHVLKTFLDTSLANYYPYSTYLLGLAKNRQRFGAFHLANQLYQESLAIRSKLISETSVHAAVCINNIGVNYFYMQEIDSSIYYLKKAAAIWKKDNKGPGDVRYATCIGNIGAIYNNNGKHNKALPYLQESLKLTAITDSTGKRYIDALEKVGSVYKRMGRYEESVLFYEEMLTKAGVFYGKEHSKYAELQGLVASLNSTLGREDKAIRLHKSSLDIMGNVYGKDKAQYAIQAFKLGGLYLDFENYEKAKEFLDQAREVYENSQDTTNSYYSSVIGDIGLYYQYTKKYERSEQYLQKQIELLKQMGRDTSSEMVIALHNLANLYIDMKDYKAAEKVQLEGMSIRGHLFGQNHPGYLTDLFTLAVIDYRRRNFQAALGKFERVVNDHLRSFGKAGAYNSYVKGLATTYRLLGRYEEALYCFEEYIDVTRTNINRNFDVLSKEGRAKFLKSISWELTILSSELYALRDESTAAAGLLYDVSLILKNLLLESNRAFLREVTVADKPKLQVLYADWLQLKRILNKQYERPINQRLNVDSLERRLEQIDEELSQSTQMAYPFQSSTTWRDVKSRLGQNETSLEFVHFQRYSDQEWSDSIMYCAILQKKDWAFPKLIPLFEKQQLEKLVSHLYPSQKKKINAVYSRELYELVWRPIEKFIGSSTKIYYSPSGLLHQVTFAAIPNSLGLPIVEQYQLHYVSSGRNLLQKKDKALQRPVSAMIYGGIDYDSMRIAPSKRLPKDINRIKEKGDEGSFSRKRGSNGKGWEYLPNSLVELNKLSKIFTANRISANGLSGQLATEESFNEIGIEEPSPDILHLATHGFFFSDDFEGTKPEIDRSNYFQYATDPLLRAGLVLAGANRVWLNKDTFPENENGILTAREISNSNLQHTKLVVLSACETALGDIRGSEGVYGLQRAFRIAGADHLITTLWKISDSHHTLEFMETFYRLWLSEKKSIHQAFRETQMALRIKYPHPYYWAGYVLME